MSRFQLRPAALADIENHFTYLQVDSPAAAERFVVRCQETFAWLARHPNIGHRWRRGPGKVIEIRTWRVDGFPNHLVIYRPLTSGILVTRVLSGVRDLDKLIR